MKTLFVYGTRPEAIKLAPLVKTLERDPAHFSVEICLTGQHREMLDQVNSFFGIRADYDLNLMLPDQTLTDITSRCLVGLEPVLDQSKPGLLFVQGDTTTVMATAIAGYYKKIPIAHVEAGLRSGDPYAPFPEEINRRIAGQIAKYHFAPSSGAVKNLTRDGITKNVYMVGNTVIDALHLGLKLIEGRGDREFLDRFSFLDLDKKIILVTAHRRESFMGGFDRIFSALKRIAEERDDVLIVFPVHLNPRVREPARRILSGIENVYLLDPLDYPALIWILKHSYMVLTDSGGIQEEAPALGKPVLVMREVTERMEGIEAGTARLVGTECDRILKNTFELLDDEREYEKMARAVNPYGDGRASERIAAILTGSADNSA